MQFLFNLIPKPPSFSTTSRILQRMTNNTPKILYFAYGSNLSSTRIRILNKSAVFKNVGLLRGYELRFCHKSKLWGGSSANIIPGPSSSYVYGVLWELDETDLTFLDKQERVEQELYKRIRVSVEVDGTLVSDCLSYQLTDQARTKSIAEHGEDQAPSKMYKSVIVSGAKEHQLPPDYVTFLENIQDCGEEGAYPCGW